MMDVEKLLDMTEDEMREVIEAELVGRIRQHPVFRADEMKHFRLVMYGTNGAGLDIIPFAET